MASYWQKYGLTADPFVDEGLICESFAPSRWQQQLDLLRHLSRTSNMILLVTGISGIGKSTFMEMLFNKIETKTGVCKVHGSPGVTPDVLQELVIRHIGMPAGGSAESNFQQRFLLQTERMHQAQDEFYLVIDNAHKLPRSSLALLLDLAEWQSGEVHPLHLVLFGGPQLDAMMAEITAQHSGEASTHTVRIEPFSAEMTRDYILHRMKQAGFQGDLPLSELQINQIHQASNGIPAKINLVARQVLLDNDVKNLKRKPVKVAKSGAAKPETRVTEKKNGIFTLTIILLFSLIVVLAIILFMLFRVKAVTTEEGKQGSSEQIISSPIKPESATVLQPAEETPEQQQAEAFSTAASTATQEQAQVAQHDDSDMSEMDTTQEQQSEAVSSVSTNSASEMSEPEEVGSSNAIEDASAPESSAAVEAPPKVISHDTPTWVPLSGNNANSASQNKESVKPTASQTPVTAETSATSITSEPPEPSVVTASSNVVVEPQVATTPVETATAKAKKPAHKQIAKRASPAPSAHSQSLTADEQALLKISPTRFTLQIAAASNYARLKGFVKEMGLTGQVYFFKTNNAGKLWYVAVYGNYPDADTAKRSIKYLPIALLQQQQVWARPFRSVQKAIKDQ